MKWCNQCKRELDDSKFARCSRNNDGLQSWCKKCKAANYQKNKEEILLKEKEDYHNNKEHYSMKAKKYYQRNKEKIKKKAKEYRDKNKSYLEKWFKKHYKNNKEYYSKHHKKYYRENKDKLKEKQREYLRTPEGKEVWKRSKLKRRRKLSSVECTLTGQQWEDIKKDQDYTCNMCGKKEPEVELTQDHILPLSRGGNHTKENIQALCRSCNAKKSNKLPNELIHRGY